MANKKQGLDRSEQNFLDSYKIEEYEKPSVSVDIVALSVVDRISENYRKPATKKMAILLIERSEHPYINSWALPGGFLRKDETIEEAARREFLEETGNTDIQMNQLKVFSKPGRDPRGWIITTAFIATVKQDNMVTTAGGDAMAASWFEIDIEFIEKLQPNIYRYSIGLTNGIATLKAKFDLIGSIGNIENATINIVENDNFSFDHNQIIAYAILFLKSKLDTSDYIYNMLNDLFTLTDLQNTYEAISGESNIAANFRRKMVGNLEKTGQIRGKYGCRPAVLYRKKI